MTMMEGGKEDSGRALPVLERVKEYALQSEDAVFLRREFAGLGSAAQVTRALSKLVADGTMVKLGLGIYAKAKASVLSGKPIPVRPIDVLAPQALRKLGVTVGCSRLVALYNAGKSTQLPAGLVVSTGNRRISRKIGFGGRFLTYERNDS